MAVSAVSSRSALRSLMPAALAAAGMVSWPWAMAVKISSSTAAIRAALCQYAWAIFCRRVVSSLGFSDIVVSSPVARS